MIIVDCIEKVDGFLNGSFKDKTLQKFSNIKGKTIYLSYREDIQLYLLITNDKFYINIMEELKNDDVQVKVFEFSTINSLISKLNDFVGESEIEKVYKMIN